LTYTNIIVNDLRDFCRRPDHYLARMYAR